MARGSDNQGEEFTSNSPARRGHLTMTGYRFLQVSLPLWRIFRDSWWWLEIRGWLGLTNGKIPVILSCDHTPTYISVVLPHLRSRTSHPSRSIIGRVTLLVTLTDSMNRTSCQVGVKIRVESCGCVQLPKKDQIHPYLGGRREPCSTWLEDLILHVRDLLDILSSWHYRDARLRRPALHSLLRLCPLAQLV